MPKKLEKKLRREAEAKGFTGERADRYVYGTLRKTGWEPERQKNKKKGKKAGSKKASGKKGNGRKSKSKGMKSRSKNK